MDLVAVGIAAFLVGGVVAGAFAWLLAAARVRALMEAGLREAEGRRAAEAARADGLLRQLTDERTLIDGAKAQLGDTFAAIAAESLRASQKDFLALANERLGAVRTQTASEAEARQAAQQKAIEGMVGPVRATLEKFDEQIRVIERERGTAYGELRQQMLGISATQERLRDATGSLVAALKAPAVRGRWGEMQLRRVVELAGMLEHCDFDEQTTLAGVDGRLRPDMIIHLPGGRRIVVDAKAPLGAYLEAREAPDDDTRAAKYRQHAAQVRAHMQKLGAKSYWEALDAAPDMVVMFLPGEPLYSVALEQMPELIEEGQSHKVMVATPMTLIALLRTASFGWREERLAENAQRISDEGRRLHERIATVMEHFADLGNALNSSVKHFNKSLRSFEQRVVVSARKLEEMDARGKKEIAPLEEIDARAVGSELNDKSDKRERQRRALTQQPLLTLAPPPDPER
ncbi:MAG TPA: DNA recombination protein RmuC [Polyangia bacterium]|jgi:DNA recombination protein RmuC